MMTNLQLWLAIGIPSFMVLLGILLNMYSFKGIEARFVEVESRFTGIEGRFTGFEGRFTKIEGRLNVIEGDLRRFYELLGEHSGRIEGCSVRITNLERK
jgi:hypothetical protein